MKCWLEFVHTPSVDAAGTLCFLHFNERRYLVGNLSEGTSRSVLQQNVGLRKATDVLLSGRTEWRNLGGLIGTILNVGEMKKSTIESRKALGKFNSGSAAATGELDPLRFHGPPNLNYLLATARRFILRQGIPMKIAEYDSNPAPAAGIDSPTWADDFVKVWVLSVLPQDTSTAAAAPPASDVIAEARSSTKSIVTKMFDSDWKLDRLFAARLPDVPLSTVAYVKDAQTKQFEKYDGPRPGGSEPVPDIEVWIREPWPAAVVEYIPRTSPSYESLSYIIRNHLQRGKFRQEKAHALGVRKGQDYGLLSRGFPVRSQTGELVTPDMVLDPSTPGTGFAFIDIPSVEYIEPTLSRPEWRNSVVMEGVAVMVWMLGGGVEGDRRIRDFQDEFSSLQHIMSSLQASPDDLILETAVKQSIRNNKLAPESFPPILADASKSPVSSSFDVPGYLKGSHQAYPMNTKDMDVSHTHIAAQRGLRVVLEPKVFFEIDGLKPPFDENKMTGEVEQEADRLGLQGIFDPVAVDADVQARWNKAVPYGDAQVLCLGTGSSHPGSYRNVSGNLVWVPGDGYYMLDAGEGTLGALRRMFPPDQLNDVLRNLRMIWISHLHADHHLGVTSVIKAWLHATQSDRDASSESAKPRLHIVSEEHMLAWLSEYNNMEDLGLQHLNLVATVSWIHGGLCLYSGAVSSGDVSVSMTRPGFASGSPPLEDASRQLSRQLCDAMSLQQFQSVLVSHCNGARAVAFTTKSGLKISYSGDCRPSYAFARIGQDSHVVIHEATFEENMRSEALAKKHSTAGEALLVAAKMNAKSVVLTHFSQRYPKMPSLDTSSGPATVASNGGNQGGETVVQSSTTGNGQTAATQETLEDMQVDQTAAVFFDADAADTQMLPADDPSIAEEANSTKLPAADSSPGKDYATWIRPTGTLGPLLAANPDLRVVMAFDGMRLSLANLPLLEAQQPRMRVMYDALVAEDEAIRKANAEAEQDRKKKVSAKHEQAPKTLRRSRQGENPDKSEKRRQNRRDASERRRRNSGEAGLRSSLDSGNVDAAAASAAGVQAADQEGGNANELANTRSNDSETARVKKQRTDAGSVDLTDAAAQSAPVVVDADQGSNDASAA